MTRRKKLLLVDDEASVRFGVASYFDTQGMMVVEADSIRAAEEQFRTQLPDAVVLDFRLPDGTALDLLPRLKEIDATVPIIIMTAFGTIDLAVRTIKNGAEQFLTKPIEMSTLHYMVERALENQQNRRRLIADRSQNSRCTVDPFNGSSAKILELSDQVHRILSTESPILITGETGTGKSMLARWIHENGPRSDEAFVEINSAGLSRDLLESELFGHEKGAFTGAAGTKQGLFEVAHRGTVLMDEIGDVDLSVQPKLLKVIEERQFRRVGSVRDRQVDIHLIAATHQNLVELVREKQFRLDLYYRINAIPIEIPPLRQRKEDIPFLAQTILSDVVTDLKFGKIRIEDDAIDALSQYDWPGNIRELRNVIERALLVCDASTLKRQNLYFDDVHASRNGIDTSNLTLAELEHQHIERVLLDEGWHVERTALRLGIARSSLYHKMKKYDIVRPRSTRTVQ